MNYEHRKNLESLPSGVQIHSYLKEKILCVDLTWAITILAGSSFFSLLSGSAAAITIMVVTTTRTADALATAHLCADLIIGKKSLR